MNKEEVVGKFGAFIIKNELQSSDLFRIIECCGRELRVRDTIDFEWYKKLQDLIKDANT